MAETEQLERHAIEASVSNSLLGCPFCGDKNAIAEYEPCAPLRDTDDDFIYWIECGYCGARGGVASNTAEAARNWNGRAA